VHVTARAVSPARDIERQLAGAHLIGKGQAAPLGVAEAARLIQTRLGATNGEGGLRFHCHGQPLLAAAGTASPAPVQAGMG